jgi:hypothetical protein
VICDHWEMTERTLCPEGLNALGFFTKCSLEQGRRSSGFRTTGLSLRPESPAIIECGG